MSEAKTCPTHMMHDPKKCNLDFGADYCSCGPFFPQRVCNYCFMSPKRHAKFCRWALEGMAKASKKTQ